MANAPEHTDAITTAVPPAPPPAEAAEPYRPLSGLAMAGFALAALFALVVLTGGVMAVYGRSPRLLVTLLVLSPLAGALAAVAARRPRAQLALWAALGLLGLLTAVGLGGLIAFTASNPWDLPWLAWALPAGALLICWMARASIARSEGTLEGDALARWGMRLALFFALIYGAYSLANTFAVRNQAKQAGDDFLALVAKGDLYQAYLRGKPEGSRPTGLVAREMVEAENRAPQLQQSGPFSRFREADFVRLVALGGASNQFERVRVAAPTFEAGSYIIEQIYKITNTLGTFELAITTRSVDRAGGDGIKRRTWHVDLTRCRFEQKLADTKEGGELFALAEVANATAQRWAENSARGLTSLAFLDTVPTAERDRMFVSTAADQVRQRIGLSPWLEFDLPEYRDALRAYRGGALLHTADFWAVSNLRSAVVAAAGELLRGPSLPFTPYVPGTRLPATYRVEGDKVVIGTTMRFMGAAPGDRQQQQAAVIFEGELLMEAPRGAAGRPALRVRQFRLLRGQTAFEGPGPPEQPPGG